MNESKRALIIKIGAIGDAIMALPLARELKQKGYTLTWVAGADIAPIVRLASEIDTLVVVQQTALFGRWPKAILEIFRVWSLLLKVQPDEVYVLHNDFRYSILVPPWLSRKKIRSMRSGTRRHHTFEYARLAHPEREDNELTFEPYCLPTETARMPRSICLFPGGARNALRDDPLRRWPLTSYVQLTKKLIEAGFNVTIAGGPTDFWIEEEFSSLKSKIRWAIGTMKLNETVEFLRSQSLVVTHDTGPLHLSSLADCPLISLFGPTPSASFGPIKYKALVMQTPQKLQCQPCYDGKNYGFCTNNVCLKSISVESVFSKISAYFQTN